MRRERRCGWLVATFAIGIAGMAASQEVSPFKRGPGQVSTANRPPVKPPPQQTSTAVRPPVKPEPEPTQTAPRPSVNPEPESVASVPAPAAVAPSMQPPPATATPLPAPATGRAIEQSGESGSALRTVGIISGGAILGFGVATGIAAIAMKSGWRGQCNDDTKHCSPSAQDSHDTGQLLADISTGTVIGGAFILAASILLLPSGSASAENGSQKVARPCVWVNAGPHGGEVMGRVQF